MMAAKTKIPNFKSEGEEARWWDAHPEMIAELFLKARKEGKIKRLPTLRGATKPITIRMPIADIEVAQEIAEKRGLAYQSYIKGLLHQALERERKAG
jgi:predicted DNA binding CopG/RHH family protein